MTLLKKDIKNKRSANAFTLSEVLLVLTIIGVVAALTIPTLLQKISDDQYKAAWKKAYSALSQATNRLVADNNGSLKWICTTGYHNCFANAYQTYFNVVKTCSSATPEGCWHNANSWQSLDGTLRTAVPAQPGFVLNNGTLILFAYNDTNCNSGVEKKCGDFWIDVNGFKNPNTIGKDIFYAYAREYLLSPGGSQYDTLGCTGSTGGWAGTGCSAEYLYK